MTYIEKIVDISKGEEKIRQYTKEEIANVQAEELKLEQEANVASAKLAAKQEVLEMLGITDEQMKLLLS